MNDKLRHILDIAIREEEYFMGFYSAAAQKSDNESVKKLFENLSAQEEMHKKRLVGMDLNNVGVISEKIDSIDVTEDAMLTPINEFNELNQILEFAIENEIKAQQLYKSLAFALDDQEAANMLKVIADEESKHEELLKKELDNLR